MKNAPNTKYSSQPLGKSPNIVVGRRYKNNIEITIITIPKKCVQILPVSVWILQKNKKEYISLIQIIAVPEWINGEVYL